MICGVFIDVIIAAYENRTTRSNSEFAISGEVTIADDQLTGIAASGSDRSITFDYAILSLVVGTNIRIG